ncbi:MAG: hypothetical protein ACFE95_11515 [Candidatus Hodarchaeota archaeon]
MSLKPNHTISLADTIEYLQYHGPLYQRFSKPQIKTQELESVKLSIKAGS